MSDESPPSPPSRGVFVLAALWAAGGVAALATGHVEGGALALAAAASLGMAGGQVRRTEANRQEVLRRERVIQEQAAQLTQQAHQSEQQATELATARDDALRAAQAKDMFLANMSHELRTPLNAVIGLSGLLADTRLSEQQQEYVDIIGKSSRALLDLIGDILDVSKLEAGRLEPEVRPFDLIACVEDALDMVATQAHAKGLELVADVGAGVPSWVVSDLARLRQILANLLNNATKFTSSGEIVVRVSARRVDDKSELRFDVRDTGIGIPADRIDRLFLPFSQVDTSTSREFGGTGLGLAISRALAGLMGGRMWVESEAGQGSTFSFTIVAATEERPVTLLNAGSRVLVADDNASARESTVRMVQSLGGVASAVASPAEALAAARAEAFELVLLDLSVHEQSAGLAEVLLREGRGRPLVALLAPRSSREPAAPPGVTHLTKPLKRSALVSALAPSPPSGLREPNAVSTAPVALRVLVVEDNPINRRVLLKMLEKLGHQADAVSSGPDALEALQKQRYRVVLLDVNMPGMDGYQVAAEIRARYPKKYRPRIIGATANALPGDREKCIAAGMDDYLPKPIELATLAQLLDAPRPPDEPGISLSTSILDPSLIQQARSGPEGEARLRQLCVDYLERSPNLLRDLVAAVDRRDLPAATELAGELQALARTVGAVQLTASLLGLTILLKSERVDELDDARDRARSLSERTEQAVGRIAREATGRASGRQPL